MLWCILCPSLYLSSPLPRTPLHAAAFADNIHGLQLLLRHQAEVDTTDKLGRTPLMIASENGHTAAVGTWSAATPSPGTASWQRAATTLSMSCSGAWDLPGGVEAFAARGLQCFQLFLGLSAAPTQLLSPAWVARALCLLWGPLEPGCATPAPQHVAAPPTAMV